ncbi:phytoene desaturase [Clostridium sp. DSM 8431]|uniref:phytoene desaturase family protein n=1 Tax=Clostridium sp. DSM 8431 TaxID=1761781 RepID=UPI0008EEECDC|nr:phytoene desaturase [Clostridium sp. DSM 8431]
MNKKIIIIGAGISGLSLAARLLHKGFKVEIFEKNSSIGGKTGQIITGNFKFDLSASILMIPEDYIKLFKDCNIDYKKYFKLTKLSPNYRCFYEDNSYYDFYSDFPHLNDTLRKITNNNINDICGYYDFIINNHKKYNIINKNFLNKSFLKYYNVLNPSSLSKILKINILDSCDEECTEYITNKKLHDFLMFQSMYIGVSPYEASSIYNTIPSEVQMSGLYYIKGGMYKFLTSLKNLVLDLGGIIHTCSEIKNIKFKDNKAYGVICNNKLFKGDAIVCSNDFTESFTKLINCKALNIPLKKITKFHHSCSVFMLYLAVDKKYPILKVHNIYINKNFKKNIESPFKNKLSKDPSLYIYCPSSIDDSLCKDNYETINIMVRVPNLYNEKIKWNAKTCTNLKKQILNILSSISGLNDIKDHILYDYFLTPLDLRDKFNIYNGSAFGISHKITESLIFRPQCAFPKLNSLYFVGSSIHPGNGISMCLKSSEICAEKIEKDSKI